MGEVMYKGPCMESSCCIACQELREHHHQCHRLPAKTPGSLKPVEANFMVFSVSVVVGLFVHAEVDIQQKPSSIPRLLLIHA